MAETARADAHGETARGGGRVTEPAPPVGVPLAAAGAFRVVAGNPGPMTYHGTNTWFVPDGTGGLTLIDPGPDDPAHLAATLRAAAGRIRHVLLSHRHADHAGNAAALAAALGLPVHGHPLLATHLDAPFVAIADGARVGGLAAVHTPGHAAEHLCFAWRPKGPDQVLFTADHVMGWSTSVVPPPPDGDAADYLASLRRLLDRDDTLYLPAHGAPVAAPHALVRTLLSQRLRRERDVRTLLAAGPISESSLVRRLYPTLRPGLDRAAAANVRGLLCKLADAGEAGQNTDGSWEARPGA